MQRMLELLNTSKKIFLFLFVGFFFQVLAIAQEFPETPNKLVSDFTQTLNASQQQALEQKLLAFEDSTSIQLAVVVMNSTGEYDIADYGDRLAQKWAIGNKKYDNGILLLVALGDRAVTIRTGYGIEGSVPDAIAYRIIENEIKPFFRQGDYYSGINNGVDALVSFTKGEYKADKKGGNSKDGGGIPIIFIVIIVIVIISIISKSGGGGKNGGGRVMGGRGSSDLFWWTLLNSLGRGGGGDGGFGGGGFGGGSGGGFGGFGGGGFGGGGASGRW